MRFCERCRDARDWPADVKPKLAKGTCEVCDAKNVPTHDVPTRLLPPAVIQLPMGVQVHIGDWVKVRGVDGDFQVTKLRPSVGQVETVGGTKGRKLIRIFRVAQLEPVGKGATARRSTTRAMTPERIAITEAIRSTGEVAVPVDVTNLMERKRVVNLIFTAAYSVGLKGRYTVRIEDGVAYGRVKQT